MKYGYMYLYMYICVEYYYALNYIVLSVKVPTRFFYVKAHISSFCATLVLLSINNRYSVACFPLHFDFQKA